MGTNEASGPAPVAVADDENLTTALRTRAARDQPGDIVRWWDGDRWSGWTWGQLAARVEAVAGGLVAAGVVPGDRVALMSAQRLDWTVADLAILYAGAVTVPIYDTSSVEQCAWILSDSQAKVAICGQAVNAKTVHAASPELADVVVLDDAGLDALADRAGENERAQARARAVARRGSDLATIIYTSGTTGNPKGCELTHANLLWTSRQSSVVLAQLLGDEDATLMFLPLAHVFARLVQFLCLEADVTIGYARSLEHLADDLRSYRPTFVLSVPRVFEKVFANAQRKAGSGLKRRIFDASVATATAWTATPHPSRVLKARHKVADHLVYAKLREALGGRLRWCVSGGAPLSPLLASFFHAAGMTILEGYGLTETTAPATVNTPQALRFGTVGQPLPGVTVRTAPDGELLVRGGNVFAGYHGDEAATREVFEGDGWLRTGDLGRIDDDGFVSITGRKKEIIVTAGGKNVAPAVLEERLKAHRLVSQAMVVGDNRPFIAALVTLDVEELRRFAGERGLSGSDASLAGDEAVRAEVDRAVDHANTAVSRAEAIRKVAVLERDFGIEHEEMTPTMKVRRSVIAAHFSKEIEAMYAQSGEQR